MKKQLKILLVEDSENDAFLILNHINKGGYEVEHVRVDTPEDMKAMLREKAWDLILSDYNMPRFNGLKALQLLKGSGLDIPFIIISGTIGEEVAVEAMRAGAQDYLMKDNLKRLLPAIERELRESLSRAGQKKLEEQQKKSEALLFESEERYRLIAENTADTISVMDLDLNLLYVSPSVQKLRGYSVKEVMAQKLEQIFTHESLKKVNKLFTQQMALEANGKADPTRTDSLELEEICKDGSTVWVEIASSFIRDSNRKAVQILTVTRDITNRKKTEAELLNAKEKAEESSRLKTEFLRNMSHEIRTPMNGIIGYSQFLDNPDLSLENQRQYTKIIINSSEQLLKIIDDILEISQLETGQAVKIDKRVSLNDLLFRLFSDFNIKAKEKGIPMYNKKGLTDNESTIYTDETKLNKILGNLLDNAIKFTQKGYIEIGYQLHESKIEIYIEDTGIGMSPENQEIIFERFSQEAKGLSRSYGGLGLGLSIAKENAELLGGKITLKSEKGKGSTFFVTIPYKPAFSDKNISASATNKRKTAGENDCTILIAEDEEFNYLYLETLIKKNAKDIKILHARNGKEAVGICSDHKEINLVLMDIKMPIINGYEAAKHIKSMRPDLPVVAQTAYSTSEDKNNSISAGCDDFISKPISFKTMDSIIARYLPKNLK